MNHTHLPYWLAALYLPGIGPRLLQRWLASFATIEALFLASSDEWRAAQIAEKYHHRLRYPDWQTVERDLAWMQSSDSHHLICLEDEAYPDRLKQIADAPIVLYLQGNKAALMQPQLAMVGTRHPTAMGLQNAHQFASALVEAGYAVTSGLALGIDGAAHRGALVANGVTIGVAGTGLLHTYPISHTQLIAEIIDKNGAVISEFPLSTPPRAGHFPRRNRIICGLSMGVLVVEAALKSGSLITASHALEQGREVFAIPGSIHHPLARGCHYLIRQGAKLVETVADVLEEFPPLPRPSPALPRERVAEGRVRAPDEGSAEQRVRAAISDEITPMDIILLRSGLTAGEVSSILLTLELTGLIKTVPGGYIRVSTKIP